MDLSEAYGLIDLYIQDLDSTVTNLIRSSASDFKH